MRYYFFALVLCIVSTMCFGQITIKETPKTETYNTRTAYDSTKNYLGFSFVETYKGQVLFVRPQKSSEQVTKYLNFKMYPYDVNEYSCFNKDYGYDKRTGRSNSNYWDLVYKYFIVDSVVKLTMGYDFGKYVLFLKDRDNAENKCCFLYDPEHEYQFPFLVVSYYNYIIKSCVNKEFMTIRDDKLTVGKISDISMNEDGYIQCEFVIGKDTSYKTNLKLLLPGKKIEEAEWNNPNGHRIGISWENNRYIEKTEWNRLVKVYGADMMKSVLQGSLKVGMPVELMYLSWGKPDDIYSSSYGIKQYIYYQDHVFVKNGRITSWHTKY